MEQREFLYHSLLHHPTLTERRVFTQTPSARLRDRSRPRCIRSRTWPLWKTSFTCRPLRPIHQSAAVRVACSSPGRMWRRVPVEMATGGWGGRRPGWLDEARWQVSRYQRRPWFNSCSENISRPALRHLLGFAELHLLVIWPLLWSVPLPRGGLLHWWRSNTTCTSGDQTQLFLHQ